MPVRQNRPNNSPPAKDGKKQKDSEVLYPCVTCGKEVESDCIECEWCYKWEHRDCAGLSNDIHKVLDSVPANVMFFCTKCEPRVKLALKFFADIQQKQQDIDDKLKQLEERLSKSVNDMNIQSGQQTTVTAENGMELEGNSAILTAKSLKLTDVTSSFTSILSEEKERKEEAQPNSS